MDVVLKDQVPETNATPGAARTPSRTPRRTRGGGDTVGFAWVHGQFHAASYRRQVSVGTWASPAPVQTLEEFEQAVDAALEALGFGGSEAFLVLAHEQFAHQMENAPGFNETAARAYLRGRVDRHARDHGESLWVSQRAASNRKDAAYVLHLLPSEFYLRINDVALRRRLDLTRIVPILVPLQAEMAGLEETAGQPVLIAAEAGDATALVVGRAPRDVLFVRTTLATWKTEPARVAVEVNRSVLYAKQQFAAIVERLWLFGASAESARAEVEAKCGAGKAVMVRSGGPAHWLDLVAKLPARQPINLVAGYLRQKRRNRLIRRAVIAACFLGAALLGLDAWSREQAWQAEHARLTELAASEEALRLEQERLTARNAEVEIARGTLAELEAANLPAVPPGFVGLVATHLPREARLTEVSVKWNDAEGRWTFRAEGTIEADEETARTILLGFRRQLARSPLRVRVIDSARPTTSTKLAGSDIVLQAFTLEGGIFED